MKKRIFLMVAILIAILGTVGIYYYNNTISIKVQSRSKKDVFFDVKYYDLIVSGLDLKIYAVPLINSDDKCSVYGTSMDFNGFDLKIICDKYSGNIKEVDIEINNEDSKEGATYLVFYEQIKSKVVEYLGADNCELLENVENNKNKCLITKKLDS